MNTDEINEYINAKTQASKRMKEGSEEFDQELDEQDMI
jgi:hypothetical protein